MLGEKIGEIAGKNYDAACFAESRWRPKNGILFSGSRISVGHKHKRRDDLAIDALHGHVLDHFPPGRDAIRRRSRHHDNQGRQDGHVDRSWCWHNEKRRDCTMPPKWSRLNKVAVLFEYAVDAEGNTHSEYWEWK